MGTHLILASTIRLSPGTNLFYYVAIWLACLLGVGIVAWAALKSRRWPRWTTQDILIVAALGVLLEVYDNIIGDQFIKPVLSPIPGADFLQVHDLPYMFLLMVGVALVRKPGCVTAMVFISFLLAALLFGSGHGVLDWTDGLTQGIFCDLYIVARGGRVFGPSATRRSMIADGLMIGILRGAPNAFLTDWNLDPYLNATFYTWLQMWNNTWSNGLFNGIEAAISAVLAQRVAVAVVPSIGIGKARAPSGLAADPFAEDDDGVPADPVPGPRPAPAEPVAADGDRP
ncbi:MAG: ECF transporter S component [Streptosporangiaceae bacterium]